MTQLLMIKLDDLVPFALNARKHSEAQIMQLAGSIREFGFTNPVLVKADRTIIAGHGRVLAARKLGFDEVPCIELANLNDAQARAYVIADNRLAETGGGWDWELLRAELDNLAGFDEIDIELTGFSPEDIPSDDLESFEVDSGEQRKGSSADALTFGDRRVPLDGDELAGMMALLDDHHTGIGWNVQAAKGEDIVPCDVRVASLRREFDLPVNRAGRTLGRADEIESVLS